MPLQPLDQEQHQPKLAVELQLEVLRHAAQTLDPAFTPAYWERERWNNLSNYCLVSRAWKAEGQKLLYSLIDCDIHLLAPKLSAFPHLGQHVRTIDAHYHVLWGCAAVSCLHLVPNLRHLHGFSRSSVQGITPQPPVRSLSPKLVTLEVALKPPADVEGEETHSRSLATVFDLTNLRSLRIEGANSDFLDEDDFIEVSSGLVELVLERLSDDQFDALRPSLSRWPDVKALHLQMASELASHYEALDLCLDTFKTLRTLTIFSWDVGRLLGFESASLEILAIETLRVDRPFPPSAGVQACIGDLVKTLAEDRTPFPALRAVRLHADNCRQNFANSRHLSGLRETAQLLRSVGLMFIDDDGVEWREEWDDLAEEGREGEQIGV